jgi:3-hydroxymyristoyl/3-hydroxydecanoyl-(acyl carrier protein) dehydratase
MINPENIFLFHDDQSFALNADNEVHINWSVPKDLPYFEGHFPGNPVLPAVALLDLSLVIANRIDSKVKSMFLTIKSSKFSEVVRPKDLLSVRVKRDSTNQSWSMDFTNQNDVIVSKLVFQIT